MQIFKTVILISCIMGTVSSMVGVALPNNSLKKQLLSIIGLMTVLCTVKAFMGDDMQLTLTMPELENGGEIGIRSENLMLSSVENEYEEYFMEKLNTNGISTGSLHVFMDTNEAGEIYVYSVFVGLEDMSRENEARSLISEDLPEAEIVTVKSDEALHE